ncbi:MAG: hypothetical protein AB8B65_09605 [Kordia sp.]|uniref:hypothetical protein n=1 Tax=Kordia sp. TaxID=1965332 RepID=UPI00385AE987
MKFIYNINGVIYSITLLLYLTIYLGMLMQILLGIVQVLFFFILLFNYDKFSEKIKNHLKVYGVLSGIYLVCFFSELYPRNNWMILILITLIPMSIGGYFTYIVHQLNRKVI